MKPEVRKRLIQYFSLILGINLLIWDLTPWFRLGFNVSHSIEGTVFIILKGSEIRRGDMVAFYPPANPYKNDMWFVKYAAGFAGDSIEVKGREILLNGVSLGIAKEKTLSGKPLHVTGGGTIRQGEIFVWTPHKDSYDSRYQEIGNIPAGSVFGRAVRIF